MDVFEYEDLREVFDFNFDFDEYSYFYHMTSSGTGKKICEEGLFLVEKDIYTTAIPIKEEDIFDIDEFLNSGTGKTDFRKEMVIISSLKGEETSLIIKNERSNNYLTYDEKANYIIPVDNIIGYIDTTDFSFYLNDNCIYPFESPLGISR